MCISHFYTWFPAIPSRKRRKTQPTLHVSVEIKLVPVCPKTVCVLLEYGADKETVSDLWLILQINGNSQVQVLLPVDT